MDDDKDTIEDLDDPRPTEDVEQERRGTAMLEFESYERIVEGLLLASDAARHLARGQSADVWLRLAQYLDQLRRAMVQLAGFDRPRDRRDTAAGAAVGLSWSEAQSRLFAGLRDAEAGANQIALGQRLDLRWTRYGALFRTMRDKANKLALASSPMAVTSAWGSGPSSRIQ
jgi:hypothetical protein